MLIFLVISIVFSILFGSIHIPFSYILGYSDGYQRNEIWDQIILHYRLPKVIASCFVGAALGVSGLQMQTLFRNPLAGPYILGISSGAGLGVALLIFLNLWLQKYMIHLPIPKNWLVIFFSALGSSLLFLLIIISSFKVKNNVSLLIIGLMFGTAVSALVNILKYYSQAEKIKAYMLWSFGSLGNLSWDKIYILVPVLFCCFVFSIFLSKQLNILLLGDEYAQSMGLNLKKIRLLIIANVSIMAGSVTAFCGPISFIGLAIPHVARMIFQTSNHLILTPFVILTGAISLTLFDIIAQLPGQSKILPINSITTLVGAPFVIWLIIKQSKKEYFV